MPYTVHTPDGQAHTYPCPHYAHVNDAGLLSVHRYVPQDRYGSPSEGPVVAAYPAGQWTHYHVEPAPYETGAQASEGTDEAQRWTEIQPDAMEAAHDKLRAMYQRHVDAGRKAAEAQ